MDGAALALRGIAKVFAGVSVVDDVSLAVPSGTLLTLLGPSGCGKTTILRMIGGFIAPTRGSIELGGTDITALPPERRPTAMVFQSYALFPHLRLRENVGFGLRMRRIDRSTIARKVDRALELVKLGHLANLYPHQMSGGQQQRAALARAIVIEPQLLLLDEPFGALDRALREEMQIELRKLQQALGMTMVFVTHDQEEAFILSDRIAVMGAGRLEQIGEPTEIYDRPRTRFVAAFMGASNLLAGRVDRIDAAACEVVLDDGARISVAPRSAWSIGDTVEVAFRPESAEIVAGTSGHTGPILPGRISFVTNRGGKIGAEIVLRSGTVMKVEQGRTPGPATYRPEDEVMVAVDERSCIPLDPA